MALYPHGEKISHFIINTNVTLESKKNQILTSYLDLPEEVLSHGNIEIRFVDEFFTCGCIGIDVNYDEAHSEYGAIYAAPYLFNVGVTQSPVFEIHNIQSPDVFQKYKEYLNNLWDAGIPVKLMPEGDSHRSGWQAITKGSSAHIR